MLGLPPATPTREIVGEGVWVCEGGQREKGARRMEADSEGKKRNAGVTW